MVDGMLDMSITIMVDIIGGGAMMVGGMGTKTCLIDAIQILVYLYSFKKIII